LAQEIVEAPITGTIINIEVKVGDKVEEGDVLLYIESMKMENPIMAPVNGKVAEIKVTVKQVVESGKPMVVIDY
jgi:glutaconyl-CoA/methylmalonyl-CoA decarboxylase subunit gamma